MSLRRCVLVALVPTLGLIGVTGCSRVMPLGRPHTYTGRTTLMVPAASPGIASPSLSKAVTLAASPSVVSDAAAALEGLGVKLTEQELSAALIVRGNAHTRIIAIEVKRASPTEAKAAADAIAAELRKEWAGKHKPKLRTVDPAHVFRSR